MFKKLTVKKQLLAMIAMVLIAFSALAAIVWSAMDKIVDAANGMEQGKDIVADVLPPPLYLIEAHLMALQLLRSTPEESAALVNKLEQLNNDYQQRNQYWSEQALSDNLQTTLLIVQKKTADEYWHYLFKELIPAIQSDPAAVDEIKLWRLYQAHRGAVDKTVLASSQYAQQTKQNLNDMVTNIRLWVPLITLVAVLLVGTLMMVSADDILGRLGGEPSTMQKLAHLIALGDRSIKLKPEYGGEQSLAASIALMQNNLQSTIYLLQEERQRLQTLLNTIPDLVWLKDLNGVYLACNPRFAQLFGHEEKDIVGKTDFDFLTPEQARFIQHQDQDAIRTGQVMIYKETVVYAGDAHREILEKTKAPVFGENGQPIGVLGVARDVTETQTLIRQLEQARQEAQRSNSAKSAFLANMSHEIRTPMNAIIGMADLALGTELNSRQLNYVSKIKSASINLLTIINDILDFSKIEAGKLQMEQVPFVLDNVFEQLTSVVGLKAEQQGLELHYDVLDDSRLLEGDPLRLGQVLTNLVSNAIKFSTGGTVLVRVNTIEVRDQYAELCFSVADQGIGMSPEQAAALFKPFAQADVSTTRKYGGTGLGLAISRQLVELMNGRIWVESELGQGSTFYFTARFKVLGPDRRSGLLEFGKKLESQAHRPILVVDDNPVARGILVQLVSQLGLRVQQAASGDEALALVEAAAPPDYLLCLIDWTMPGLDGIATIRRLRALYAAHGRSAPPMILVTAYSHHDHLDAVAPDIDGFLAKPVSARHLYVEMAACLGLGTEQRPQIERRRGMGLNWSRFHGLDVLIVEDVEINREVIGELFAEVGLPVRFAVNGEQALEAISQRRPDVVLMDVHMPVMDGYTATQQLRAQEQYADLPIIALTANALKEEEQRCFQVGMNAHVTKPVQMEILYAQMVKCLPEWRSVVDIAPSPEVVAHESQAYPDLPGIDVAVALSRVKKLPLLMSLLAKFRDANGQSFEPEFRAACHSNDWESQVILAHNLKGVARTLGAYDLGEAAASLERASKAQHEEERDLSLAATVQQLRIVVQGLQQMG